MENKKKKYLIIGASAITFLLLVFGAVFLYCRCHHVVVAIPAGIVSVESAPSDGYYHKKPIKLELMTDQEKLSFGISTSTSERAQVLERDASGKPTVYRLVFSNSDILNEY